MNKLQLENFQCNNQLNNIEDPYYTCFPSSVASGIRCLEGQKKGRKRPEYMVESLDDVFVKDMNDNLSSYKKMALKIGAWTSSYHPRTIYMFWEKFYFPQKVEGYQAKYASMTFQEIKDWMKLNESPVCIGTKFTRKGHIVCIGGYDETGFIVNDPYGNAMEGYNPKGGVIAHYPYNAKGWVNSGVPELQKYNCLLITRG